MDGGWGDPAHAALHGPGVESDARGPSCAAPALVEAGPPLLSRTARKAGLAGLWHCLHGRGSLCQPLTRPLPECPPAGAGDAARHLRRPEASPAPGIHGYIPRISLGHLKICGKSWIRYTEILSESSEKSLWLEIILQIGLQSTSEMLKRKLRYCHLKRCKLLLVAAFTLLTLSVVKIHQNAAFENHRHLEIREDPYSPVSCTDILRGDKEAIEQAKLEILTVAFKKRPKLSTSDYINMTRDCDTFTKERKYILQPLSKEEAAFPIAYSIVVHHKIDMFEKLLRTIYAPQNHYCIHVDKKSPESFLAAVKGIVSCFENVFIASQLESVVYASWSRVQADLNCMKDLYRRTATWKYLINLCGVDFPIKTNLEMVEKLKALKGENSLETEKMPSNKEWRWRKHHEVIDGTVKSTGVDKQPPPFGMSILSGSAYFVISRQFVEYVLENEKILKFIEWAKDTYSPDEYLWATIQRYPEAPGFVPTNDKYDVSDMNAIARFVKWHYFEGDVSKGAPYPHCSGIHVRSICVFGAGDLNWMLRTHHLFANKFDTDVDPFAIKCLEEYLREKALYQQS